MQNVKRMLVDVSSVVWMSLYAGKDKEFGREVVVDGRKHFVNSAGFGFENAIEHLTAAMRRFDIAPWQMIFVYESGSSKSVRSRILPQYKAKSSHCDEQRVEFHKLKDMLLDTFLGLGAHKVTQHDIEADDVIAYLSQKLPGEIYIASNDGDLSILVNDRVHLWRKGELDEQPYGPFPRKYTTLYKGLVGDTSDSIPGARGFGDKAFLDLYCLFGEAGLKEMERVIKERDFKSLEEDVSELKALRKVIDNADEVCKSYKVAQLWPEDVNTLDNPLQWNSGLVRRMTKDLHESLKPYAGRVKLVHEGNYKEAVAFMLPHLKESPFVSLDIETSTCDESDEWLMNVKKRETDDDKLGVDVFGSELTGLGLTFGKNLQYTFYFTVDHRETDSVRNVSKEDVLAVIKQIPFSTELECAVHNDSFELSVLKRTWQDDKEWQDNGWHGFLPNVRDTIDCASYVDENESFGLKKLSARLLGYQQTNYDEVTQMTGFPETLPYGGRVLSVNGDGEERRVYRMNELTAEHVLDYGADDTICTAALFNHFRIIMEIEETWEVFKRVEQKPAYLAALSSIQGTPFSLERLKQLEKDDDKEHEANWKVVRDFLLKQGWDGTVCPVYQELTPAAIKEAVWIVTGSELETKVRTPSKFPAIIRDQMPADDDAELIASFIENGSLKHLNELVARHFDGEPKINFDSPKQMQKLLYSVLKLPLRIVNKLTEKERENKELREAHKRFNKIAMGSEKEPPLTPEETALLMHKATSDDTAVEFALTYDCPEGSESRKVLEALVAVKKIETRRKLYYRPYPLLMHWKDRKLHPSLNQNQAVTRRYSDSGPNRQQLPKKGEGVKVREIVVPHRPDAVIVSIDFSGQELRLMAGQSGDKNMLSCYIGNNLRDIHSITASGAMVKKWGKDKVDAYAAELGVSASNSDEFYDMFLKLRKSEDKATAKKADDLRKDGKNVNFATQFDAQALKVSHMTIMSVADAQAFIDAKVAMFPRVETWKDEVRNFVKKNGYVTTMLGARRHLREQVRSDDHWIAEKAGRQGPNFKIQGSAAEMTKLAMARLWDSGALFEYDAIFIAPIHDELVASVRIDHAFDFIKIMHECMTEQYADLCVPVMGSISLGPNFGLQYEAGDEFIANRITSIISTIREKHFGQNITQTA